MNPKNGHLASRCRPYFYVVARNEFHGQELRSSEKAAPRPAKTHYLPYLMD